MSAESEKNMNFSVLCPRCQTTAKWSTANPYRPFCSRRCRFIDLNDWTTEKYKIPAHHIVKDTIYDDVEHN